MKVRYRYRIEPTSVQAKGLSRVFGCCRVVFNDALGVRDQACRAGEKISDTEIQRRVITQAKTSEQRAWLAEVPSVALVQSVNDSRRAWRNFFDSTAGKRKGRKVGRPRFKSRKDHRQSFRLTATIAATDGQRTDVDNPNHLGRKLRKLRRLEQQKSRRQKGSNNRDKTRQRIAIAHNEVARARRDYHHKQALALVRENQVIYVEDINVVGMVANRRLARVISDAGWGQFVRIIGEKAARYGRTAHSVSRWLASSKTCSACQHRLDELPLQVRAWTCPACRAVHDRDHNAAKVILAAGRAERRNAYGASLSPPKTREVRGDEAGSTPAAA
jgi:IS605 OrfB family transposase